MKLLPPVIIDEINVARSDIGKVICRHGSIINDIRSVVSATIRKFGKKAVIETDHQIDLTR